MVAKSTSKYNICNMSSVDKMPPNITVHTIASNLPLPRFLFHHSPSLFPAPVLSNYRWPDSESKLSALPSFHTVSLHAPIEIFLMDRIAASSSDALYEGIGILQSGFKCRVAIHEITACKPSNRFEGRIEVPLGKCTCCPSRSPNVDRMLFSIPKGLFPCLRSSRNWHAFPTSLTSRRLSSRRRNVIWPSLLTSMHSFPRLNAHSTGL